MLFKVVVLVSTLSLVKGAATREDMGVKYLTRIYDDCHRAEGVMPCLKKKAILFFDRAARMDSLPLIEGVDVVKTSEPDIKPISENEIEATLPRNMEDKDEALSKMLWDRVAAFTNSRTIQLSLPKISGDELNQGVEEVGRAGLDSGSGRDKDKEKDKDGRGKMKKMMGMMMMGAAMKMAAMIPMAIAGLFVLAGKALITAKIALLLAGIMVLKKLMSQKGGGGGGHESHGWSSGGGGSGGWDRRSYTTNYNDVSDLAYSAYKPQ